MSINFIIYTIVGIAILLGVGYVFKKRIKTFLKLIENMSSKKRHWSIFLVFLFSNLLYFLLLLFSDKIDYPLLTGLGGDARDYVELSEIYYKTDCYGVYRMPGFLMLFYPLLVLFGKVAAVNILLIIQTILSAIAKTIVVVFIKTKINIQIYIISIFLLLFASPISMYNNILYTESLASSLTVLFLFVFIKSQQKSWRVSGLFISGLLFSILCFLRPFCLCFLLPIFVYLFICRINYKTFILHFILFIIPFTIMDGIWTIRNYAHYKEFIPLETSIKSNGKIINATRYLIKHYGGIPIEWNKEADGTFFAKESFLKKYHIERPTSNIFPSYIFTNELTIDSLIYVRQAYEAEDDETISPDSLFLLQNQALNIISKFDNHLQNTNSFRYYIVSRVVSVKKAFFQINKDSIRVVKILPYPINVYMTSWLAFTSFILLCIGGIFSLYYFIRFFFIKDKSSHRVHFLMNMIIMIMTLIFTCVFIDHEARWVLVIYYLVAINSIIGFNDLYTGKIIKNKKLALAIIILIIIIGIFCSGQYVNNVIKW